MQKAIQDIKNNYVVIFIISFLIFIAHTLFFTYIPPTQYLKMFMPFLFVTFVSRFVWVLLNEVIVWKH